MSLRAWAAFYMLHTQKAAGCLHTNSKLSQLVKSWEQRSLLIPAHCANLQLGNFILQICSDKLHLTGATTEPWGLIRLFSVCLYHCADLIVTLQNYILCPDSNWHMTSDWHLKGHFRILTSNSGTLSWRMVCLEFDRALWYKSGLLLFVWKVK